MASPQAPVSGDLAITIDLFAAGAGVPTSVPIAQMNLFSGENGSTPLSTSLNIISAAKYSGPTTSLTLFTSHSITLIDPVDKSTLRYLPFRDISLVMSISNLRV